MKKRVFKVIGLILIFSLVVLTETMFKKNETSLTSVEVFSVNESLEIGDVIDEDNLVRIDLLKDAVQPSMVTDIDEVVGHYVTRMIYDGEIIVSQSLGKENPLNIKPYERLITTKCNVVESNGWVMTLGDPVDLVLVNADGYQVIEDAIVFKMFDEFNDVQSQPEYYSFIVTIDQSFVYYQNVKQSDIYISIK